MKEKILDKSDILDSLDNKNFLFKRKKYIIISSITLLSLLATIILFLNRNIIMNFSSNSINKLINKENDINYSFVVEYITESEDQTI